MSTLFYIGCTLVILFILVIIVAVIILIERKLLAVSQRRIGPVVLGKRGILQIVADVVKPLFKDIFETKLQTQGTIALSLFILLATQFVQSALYPYGLGAALYDNLDFILILQSVLSVFAHGCTILLGVLTGSKYGLIGAQRLIMSELANTTAATFLNYMVCSVVGGFEYELMSLNQAQDSFICVIGVTLSVVSLLATFIAAQRSPLDLIEVEGELVAGYNIEYSGPDVLVIYFAEYFHLFNAALQLFFTMFGLIPMVDALLCNVELQVVIRWSMLKITRYVEL